MWDFLVQVRWGEALTQGCIEQSNVYDIYDASNGNHIFVALERSEDCARCCCAPSHSLFVEIKTTAGMQVRVRATATATARACGAGVAGITRILTLTLTLILTLTSPGRAGDASR